MASLDTFSWHRDPRGIQQPQHIIEVNALAVLVYLHWSSE
jgi:hypothetical protein